MSIEESKARMFSMLDSINRHRELVEKRIKGFPYKIEININPDEYIYYCPNACRIFYRNGQVNGKLVEQKIDIRIMCHDFLEDLEEACKLKMNELVDKFYDTGSL